MTSVTSGLSLTMRFTSFIVLRAMKLWLLLVLTWVWFRHSLSSSYLGEPFGGLMVGSFLGFSVMEVWRDDIFDFRVKLDQGELNKLKAVSDEWNNELDDMLLWILQEGLNDMNDNLE